MDPLLTDTPDQSVGFQSFLNKHVKGIPDKQEVAPAPAAQEEYVPSDVAFAATPTEPQQVDQPLLQDFVKNIDPRTAVPVGTYTEEEIQGAAAEEVAASIIKQNVPALRGFDAETLKLLVEKDPKAGVHNDLVSIAKTHASYMYKMQKASEAAMAVKSPSDVEALNMAIGLYDEAILERQKVPMEYPERGLVHEIIRNTSEQVGLLGRMAYSAEDDILKGAAVGVLAGAAFRDPRAAWQGVKLGAQLGGGKGMIEGGFVANRGEILFSLIHPNQPKLTDKYGLTSGTIPLDVALPLADKYGAIAGVLESAELGFELISLGVATKIAKRIAALSGEYGTEATQQIIGMYARFEADKIMAERNGETFDQSFDTRLDWYEANQAGRAAMLGAFGMSAPSMTYQGGKAIAMSHPIETLQALSNSKNIADQEAVAAAESVRSAMQENVLNNPPTVPTVDADEEATNELVSGDPLSFNEVNANRHTVAVRGTDITIADLDDLTVSADDTQLEEALDTLETKASNSLSDRTAVFLSGLYDFYSVEEADSFEQLLTGRANATGMSLSDYIDFRGLELNISEEKSDQYKGYADITNEHNVIINLFQNADISTIVHEAGHVFSLDLKGDDKVIIEEFLGVEQGTVWGVVEQEKWAKAWETYVGEGKAPSPKMDNIFKKFAHWLATIYGSVKNLGVDITPEVRGVFDRMLTTDKRNELATNTLVTEQINEVMNSGEVIRNESTATTTATPEASQTAQDVIINEGIRNEATATTTTSQKLDTAAEISNSKEELVENILTQHYQEKIRADREAFERVEQMQEEEATILYQNVQARYGERIEDTDEADIARADKLDAYMNRVGKEYGVEVGAIKRRKLSEKQTWRLQKLALAKVMQRMFDAGDKHGYAMARAAMKALLARERARYALYNKHKALRQSFQEKLKKGSPQKEGGKSVLKMDPAAALFLQTVSRLLEGAQTFKGIRGMYEKMKLGYPVGYLPSQEEVLANKFIEAAGIRSISSLDKLKQLNTDLADFIKDARSDSPANKRKAQKEKDVEDILTEIRGSRDVMGIEHTDTVTETSRLRETLNKGKTKAQRLATSILGHEVFGSFISNIQNVTAYAGRVHGKFYKICDFFDAKHAKTSDIRRIQDNFINKAIEIYKLKGKYSAYQMWKEHNKRQFDVTGLGDLYSRSELKYLWLLWQDKTITNRLVNMHITEEVMAKVDTILTPEDKAMAEYTKAFFNSDEVYNKVNGVHVRVYGAALNRVKDYVPLTVEGVVNEMEEFAGQLMVSQFQMDALARSSDTRRTPQSTGHIKNRTDSKHPIVIRSLESAFSSYVSEIFHFVHFAEQAQRVAAILKDTRIRRAIEIEYDSKILGTIDEQFKNVIADGANLRNMYNTWDKFRSAWIQSKLGLAVPVFLKQNISQLQMLAEYDIPVLPFIKNYMKFFNPAKVKGNFQELFNGEYYKNRRTSNDRDITAVISAGAFEEYSLNPTITNFFMLPVLLGDSVANSVSGWVAVECLVEQGVPRQTAVKRVAKIVERSMQSSHMQEQTVYQTGGTFARFMTTFSSGPIQMARKEVQAIKDYAAGKIGKSQLAKVFFINHLLVPALYGIVSDILTGSEEDDRDKLIKYGIIMALGPFGSTYAISDVVMSTVSAVFGIKSYAPSTFVQDTAKDIERVTKAVVQNDFDSIELHDWAAAIEGALTFMGIGVPLKRTAYIGENLAEGDVIRAAVGMRPEGN